MTPLRQRPFFIDHRKQGGLLDGSVADCPLYFTSPNAPTKPARHWLTHIAALRCDLENPPSLRMQRVVGEEAARPALDKIEKQAGLARLREHPNYGTRPLLSERCGHQEGAMVSYNPHKPERPSHNDHS